MNKKKSNKDKSGKKEKRGNAAATGVGHVQYVNVIKCIMRIIHFEKKKCEYNEHYGLYYIKYFINITRLYI